MDADFRNNVILTQTERLIMSNRPKQPKYAKNKNILVIGGSALELYVSGSLNVFNHCTNVDIENRLVCFDIKELGKQLKKLGTLVIQDQV